MKSRIKISILIVAALLVFSACSVSEVAGVQTEPPIPAQSETQTAQPTVRPTMEPTSSPAPQISPLQPFEAENPAMYTSYAHMRSFNPSTGIALFDYFDILVGDEAVDWLINGKGYCSVDAQTQVDAFADSEYIEKNTNPQLRAINLKNVPLMLMYTPSGKLITEAIGEPADFADVVALWNVNQNYVLYSHFYYITVDEDTGEVLLVEQVYWP